MSKRNRQRQSKQPKGQKHNIPTAVRTKLAQAHAQMQSGDTLAASQLFKEAWETSNRHLEVLKIAGHAFVELGDRDNAFKLLEDAIARHGQTEEISVIMGQLAVNMRLDDVAEKAFRAALNSNPGEPSHYVNLTRAMAENGRAEEAIAILQDVIPMFPDYAKLWNAIGVLVKKYLGKGYRAQQFFEQAYALDPNDVSILVNVAQRLEAKDAIPLYKKAIQIEPRNSMAHLSLATDFFVTGEYRKAWPHYEYRLDDNTSEFNAPSYKIDVKRWSGERPENKTVLVMAEQGIGDEVFFAMVLPKLIDVAKKVIISCDPRLCSIYERSFPGALVISYEDSFANGYRYREFPQLDSLLSQQQINIDFAIPLGSVASFFWSTPTDMPVFQDGYLRAHGQLIDSLQHEFKRNGRSRKIGLSWRSGLASGSRKFSYPDLDSLNPLKEVSDVTYVALQYGAEKEELDYIRNVVGLPLVSFDELDLKQDIEANLAIMSFLDCVIGPCTATQMFAMATGCETKLIAWGVPWWAKPDPATKRLIHNPKATLIECHGRNWGDAISEAAQQLVSNT